MRLFVLAITLAIFASLAATPPAYTQDANPELTADLQKWLVGSWMCRYSRSMRMQAIYGADKQFEWIFHIGMVPYATTIRIFGSYEITTPGNDGHAAMVLATIQGSFPEDPQYQAGREEQADFTRAGPNALRDSTGDCERGSE
jgi:hypothetical protein